ncbi:MAG: T9SS type A sorting domain-containing protein, partial [Bacteroidota bacterium]|nr:T9SS type A sorting domain-containing protein [Bacteroidota bacterium]
SSLTVTVNSPSICSGASASLTATGANVYSWSTTATTNSITVNPTITTTYKVTGTTSGCTGTAMAIVTLYANPTANAGADVTIKNGNSVNLSATGGDAYSWSNGSSTASITVGPTITSTYYVTVINNGCTATDAVVVFVTNNCIANAGPDATICKGSSVSLTGSGGNLYKWSNGAVGATISVNPSVTTTYYLTITTTNGCTSVDNVVVNVGSIIHANAGVDKSICIGQSTILTATGGGTYKWNTGSRLATITVNPTLTTTYVVTVNQSFTCSGTDNVVIFVNNTPATVNAGPDKVICKGQSVTLTATGNGTFSWNTGSTLASITVNPIVLKLYTVTINSEGCTASDAAVVRVNNLPIANAGSDKSVCKGNSVTLSATGGALYKWSTGATSSSISVVPSVTTTYIVTVSTSTACSASDNIIISVNNCKSDLEGIAQNIISGVNIYPVPSNGIFYLEGKNIIAGNINIKVFDILGKCIYDQYYKSSGNTLNNVINLSGNPDGIYMLQIEINNQRIFRKLIIN